MIEFEVSGLEESSGNALTHYEIKFSEPVNADWLISIIRDAIDSLITCPDCGNIYDTRGDHWCKNHS